MMMVKAFKRRTEAVYAFRMIDLIRKPFDQWDAFEMGIIDRDGNVVKDKLTAKDKIKWSRFHSMVANVKKMLARGPKRKSELELLWRDYRVLREEYLSEEDVSKVEMEFPMLVEEMVSGDAGGDPNKIAAGTNSGAVVYPGPGGYSKKKKAKKKMTEMLSFTQFAESLEAEKIEALRLAEEEANKVIEPESFTLKSIGSNGIFVESVNGELTKIEFSGKTTRNTVTEADLKEAFAEHGKDGVLAYVKEATQLVWKFVS